MFFGQVAKPRQALHSRKSDPTHICEAASDGKHGVGSCIRPVAPGSFEPVPDDAIAGAFHDAGSDRRPRVRQRSQRIRSLLASQVRMQAATASNRSQCSYRATTTRLESSVPTFLQLWPGMSNLTEFNHMI